MIACMTLKIIDNTYQSRLKKVERGFTLTEIAIVLGIIGLILGAIWTAAAAAYENNKLNKAQTQLIAIANNMKKYAGAIPTNGNAQTGLCKLGIFPPDMLATPGNCNAGIIDPWGHYVVMNAIDANSYQLQYTTVTKSHCIGLLVRNGNQAAVDAGLIGVSAGAQGTSPGGSMTMTGANLTIPVTPANASDACMTMSNFNGSTINGYSITFTGNAAIFFFQREINSKPPTMSMMMGVPSGQVQPAGWPDPRHSYWR